MTTRRTYSYTVLRYVHDPLSGEFVNVGLVVFAGSKQGEPAQLLCDTRKTIGRMSTLFPDLEKADFTAGMRAIDRALSRLAKQTALEGMFPSGTDVVSYVYRALPRDDSSLQWSPVGTGLSDNIEQTFEHLYQRFVSRYDQSQITRRSDDEIWRPVRARLEERHIGLPLEPKIIRSGDDEIEFQHAWKNGAWHVYEPISLDLADAEGIHRKAHRWLGALTSLANDSTEPFLPHLIVGAPSDPKLDAAYQRALRIMQKAPNQPKIFEENQVDRLVDLIEEEVRAHRAH